MHAAPSIWTKLFYGVGSVAYGVKDNGFSFFLLLYYNQVLGLPEAWVGLGIMIALVLDGLFDPIVGYVSDNLHSRWGRRHPFMYFAAAPVAVSYFFLWNPPAGLAGGALFAYFLGLVVLIRMLITCYEIPSSSLVAELSTHYDQRTSLLSYRYFFGWWGGLAMAVLAYGVFLQPDAGHAVGVLNPVGYRRYGTVAALIMVLAILVSAMGTHGHIPHLRRPSPRGVPGLRGTVREVRETLANPSVIALLCAGVFFAMAAGVSAALSIYFNTYFWELTSDQITMLVVANFVSAVVAFALAPALSARLGKKRAAVLIALTALVIGPGPIVLRLAGAFPANHSPALLPTLLATNTTFVTLFIIASILIAAMVADVVEDSEVLTGRRSEGVLFAANSFVQKTVSGVGIFASSLLLRAIGFPRHAHPGEIDPGVVRALGLAYTPVLVLLYLVAIGFLGSYRLTRASHEANLARLAGRTTRTRPA